MSILSSTNTGVQYFIDKWFKEHVHTNGELIVVKDKNGKFKCIDVIGNVIINSYKEPAFPEYIKFGNITGSFECSYCDFESMNGFPQKVDKDFTCFHCSNICSIEGLPNVIGRDCIVRFCGKPFTENEIRAKCDVKRNVFC